MRWLLVLVILLWGTNFVFYKILLEHFPFWTLFFMRNLFASLALLWAVRKFLPLANASYKIWGYIVGAGILAALVNNYCFQMGLQRTVATNASLIMGLTPLTTALISYAVFKVPLHWKQMLGILLGFAGVLLVVLKGSLQNLLHLSVNIGDLFIVGTLVCFSLSFIFVKKATDAKVRPDVLTFYAHASTLVALTPMMALEQTRAGWTDLPGDPMLWGLMLFVGIFITGVGNLLWNRGITVLGPSQAAIFMNGVPVVAAATSVIVLHEPILWVQIIGFLFIGTGVVLGSQTQRSKRIDEKQGAVHA